MNIGETYYYWRSKWCSVTITGEINKGEYTTNRPGRVNKETGVYSESQLHRKLLTEAEMLDAKWRQYNRRGIMDLINDISDTNILKQVALLIEYKEKPVK